MITKMCDTACEMGEDVAKEIAEIIKVKPNALICIAAGNSSLPLFESLIKRHQKGEISFQSSYFIAMDEWLGMNKETQGSCSDFLISNFLSKVDYPCDHIRLVDAGVENLEKECQELYQFIEDHGGMDYIVLGVGMNGHLALNEPGVSFEESVHVSQIDSVTRVVGKKYFKDAPQLEGGLTIGIADIRKAKKVVLMVSGEAKADILQKILQQDVNTLLPATVLKEWPHSVILYDASAANKL